MIKRMKWLAIPMALLLVMLTGCQAVGGLDINKALANSMNPSSSESKQKISIELVPAADISAEDQKMIDLINSLYLIIDSGKVQDKSTASIKGSVGFQGKELPYQLSIDKHGMVIQLEGAKQPLYISLDDSEFGYPDMSQYEENIQGFSQKVVQFAINHAPNPTKLSVKQVQDKVNGESLALTNLHVEVNGEELLAMVKPFLTEVVKDEAGLKELINAFYDTFYPVFTSMEEEGYDVGTDLPVGSKGAAVGAIHGELIESLNKFLNDYDASLEEVLKETPELTTVLGKNSTLNLDLYLDGKQNIRKQNLDLAIALPADEYIPFSAIKLHTESEIWNNGAEVSIDKIDTSAGVLDITEGDFTPGQMLRNFEADSLMYKTLKNDLKITEKLIWLDPEDEYDGIISKKNVSFAPLRYLSEQLDAEVKWTKGSQQIVIIDDLNGREIMLTVGSDKATIGGQSVTLPQPVFVHSDGTTYVPLRFIAESLGATVTKDADGWIIIERK
ncbi:copper amine oxidase N-terminal domain-containing protein [Paenibacillus motobuensis]|uniref:copper amine oxidase N-terminal domain-containing protein n=1 Tax=Paenibacillus TaxID=44249 RepID=UPI00203CDFAD|nr:MULTISPECIES: copper amine oxidase N-terminal domain-containing protein [Paenibacillus]MCM3038946.1 copper amine oxidase N-terminal domain-containing protein [Paenibacillus lutimineralis]MCM3646050.1 copper amine oxidase N-terminal domain-containing protein [Paenibacillus motobuensis]